MERVEDAVKAKLEEYDLATDILKNVRKSYTHFAQWRKEAKEDYDFYEGKQWSDEDVELLREEGRPAVTFNRIIRTVNAILGLELQNRQEVTYFPVNVNDSGVTDLMNDAAKWARNGCDAEDEESEAFEDMIVCGQGWTQSYVDYDENPDGNIIIERIDPLEMGVDPTSKKRNFDDSRYRFRVKAYSKEEFRELWPNADVEPSDLNWFDGSGQTLIDHNDDEYKYPSDVTDDRKNKTYEVIYYQYFEKEPYYRVFENGNLVEFDEERFKLLQPMLDSTGVPYVRQMRKKFKYVTLCGKTVLDKGDCPTNGFSLNCMTGLRARNTNTWFGIIRLMKDPQRWANKWLSQIQHIINTNAKGGIFYEQGAIANPRAFNEEWARPDAKIELNAGGLQKIQQREMPRYPDGIDRLLQYAMSAIDDVTGVSAELLGVAGRAQAGYLEDQRKQSSVTVLAKLFDSKRRYTKESGRTLQELISRYISDGRLMRLEGDDGNAQYIPLLREYTTFEYDISIDEAPTSPNQKEKVFGVFMQLLQPILQAQIPIPPDILDYSPLPTQLVQKWKKYIEEKSKPTPEQEEQKQIAKQSAIFGLQEQEAMVAERKSKAILNVAKANEDNSDTDGDGIPDMIELEKERIKNDTARVKSQADLQKSRMTLETEILRANQPKEMNGNY